MLSLYHLQDNGYNLFILSFVLSSLLGIYAFFKSILYSEKEDDSEKVSPYECGFSPFSREPSKVNIQFFTHAVLFLIFDLEVIFLLPISLATPYLSSFELQIASGFLILLGIALVFEIKTKVL